MVITPVLRGLFGISIDAQSKTITVNPHLPASWDHAEIRGLRAGDETVDLSFVQTNSEILISAKSSASGIKLRSTNPQAKSLPNGSLSILRQPVEIEPFFQRPVPGARTQSPHILSEKYEDRRLTLVLEGVAGSEGQFSFFVHPLRTMVRAEGADLSRPATRSGPDATSARQTATVHFPSGTGWKTATVNLIW